MDTKELEKERDEMVKERKTQQERARNKCYNNIKK